ncbi:MAG: DNA-deoxyinosine glycosylase, partial [Spirochaetales bacterium]|nr:DNA-deoxyinosine glycosylase [Spirochaetales bacterium]
MPNSAVIQIHPFPPLFNDESKILILGSFPSVKSRENQFYYGNPQNRFWKLISAIFGSDIPTIID